MSSVQKYGTGSGDRNSKMDGKADLLATTGSQPENDTMPSGTGTLTSSMGSPRLNNSATSQSSPDISIVKNENRALKARIRQLQFELQSEQDQVSNVRRRLNALERGRLENLSKSNEEVSLLDAEVAKLRAQVEKGEAVRQNLEFELAKARKEVAQENRAAYDRETILNELSDSMKAKISELSREVELLSQELSTSKNQSQAEIAQLNDAISEKNKGIAKLQSEHDILEREKARLENALKQQESLASELDERLREAEGERRENTEVLRKQVYENDIAKDREERLKRDLELAVDRIRSLEENIEAERAAHLESKFNSEIVQLRIRDLESALNLEKAAKAEAVQKSEKLSQQVVDLQKVFEAERKVTQEDRNKLEKDLIMKCVLPATRAEKEYAVLSNQLSSELQDKKNIIKKLSEQLEVHQKNFDDLKDELNKAKKRQIFLEESYGGSTRELELILSNFSPDGSHAVKKSSKSSKKKDSPMPSALLENLRVLLSDLRRNSDNTASELSKLKSQHEKTSKDCTKYQELAGKRERALQTAEQNLNKANKELKKLKSELGESEKLRVKLAADLNAVTSKLEKELKENVELKEQTVSVALRSRSEESKKLEYFHNLYQQLLTGRVMDKPYGGTDISKFTWTELSVLINEQVAVLINSLLREGEKTKHLENVISTKEHMLQQMQKGHEENIQKLAMTSEERLAGWVQQKAEMEEHYNRMLAEIQDRHKKSQDMADEAWEKIRSSGSIQRELEEGSAALRDHLTKAKEEQQILLSTSALLIGALYPAYTRLASMTLERQFLMDCLSKFLTFKDQVQALVDAISPNQGQNAEGHPLQSPRGKEVPILRFRVAVVAVMAANRLANGRLKYCQLFTAYDPVPGVLSSIVCAGGIPTTRQPFVGVARANATGSSSGPDDESTVAWLNSSELMSIIMATMKDLQYAAESANNQDMPYSGVAVASSARTCFSKLISHFANVFPNVAHLPHSQIEKSELSRKLRTGLSKIVAQKLAKGRHPFPTSQSILGELQCEVLQFTKRLHKTEVERRDLRQEVMRLAKTSQNIAQSSHISRQMHDDLTHLKTQLDHSVTKERFMEVCKELEAALNREQEAERLLVHQANQIQEIGSRLDRYMSDGSNKEQSLTGIEQALSEAKVELRHHEQMVRQLNRQLQQDEESKKSLQNNLRDAEAALRTAVKDKETLTLFVKNVQNSLEKMKLKVSAEGLLTELDLASLLSPDLVPVSTNRNRQSPELTACQVLVSAFVDAQQQINLQIRGLQDELKSHKDHINQLKKELNAACERHYSSEIQMRYTDFPISHKRTDAQPERDLPIMGSPRPSKLVHGSGDAKTFSPLLEDSSDTLFLPGSIRTSQFGMPKPTKKKMSQKHSKKT